MKWGPYTTGVSLNTYTWTTGDYRVDVRRLKQDKHIGPDINECKAAGMKTEEYDTVIRWWRKL